ncbi:MAG: GNAT family N-acetyltransferase [Anaerolineaceae bacterium]
MNNHLPASVTGYIWRPARREDAPAIYRLYEASDREDRTHFAESLESVYNDFDKPNTYLERDTVEAISETGELTAIGWIFINPIAESQRRAFLWGTVHPQHRRRGLGTAMIRWEVDAGTRRLNDFDDGVEHALCCISPQHTTDRIHLFEREGLNEVRRYYSMNHDLSQTISPVAVKEGVQIIPWDTARNDEALEVCNTAFRDHWGTEPVSAAIWNLEYVGSSDFHPEVSRMAICDGKLVGIVIADIPESQLTGKRRGHIRELGVLREYRKQGIASALLTGAMQSLHDVGMDVASLSVDTQNLTGALRLYENLGFTVHQVSISYAAVVKAAETDRAG